MEVWRDVTGYQGLYQVSDMGRVRRTNTGRILKQSRTRGDYLMVGLSKNNRVRLFRVNRLVALAFVPNPEGLPQAGHLDDNKSNNWATNLYWTDAQENNTHNGKHWRVGEAIGKPIVGTGRGEVMRFASSLDAGRHGFNASAIRNCLTGRAATHKGFIWAYEPA